ncbi:MAG: Uma2 family endonuclease [Chloroflexaceae bacterium]|jgi:Uma2 family endonuclease|nr:Uma2 family endonuclease [Chloroflexaceae bacterium]
MTTDILPVAGLATHLAPPAGGRWHVADYEQLPEDGLRYEIVDGELHMAPAPNTGHQTSSGLMFYYIMQKVQLAGLGRVFSAPFDVELGPDTVVQPDIVVVLHNSAASITEQRIVGPPDLVVEITSPSTASYDRREKHDAYAAAGVREYWIADPASRTIELFILDGASYRLDHVYRGQAVLPSSVLPAWDVVTERLFG